MKYLAFYIFIWVLVFVFAGKECMTEEPKLTPALMLVACAVVAAVIELFFLALGVLFGLIQIQFV